MPTFKLNGNVEETEQFLDTIENLNRDVGHVEDRLQTLYDQGLEVQFKIDEAALDQEKDNPIEVTVKDLGK
jgi:hypothetical protein